MAPLKGPKAASDETIGPRIFLSLGSNLGDRAALLKDALRRLRSRGIRIVQSSSRFETEPVGVTGQPDFLNLVCEVQTGLEPEKLLEECLAVEKELGRSESERSGPRLIDIDLLFYGDLIRENRRLTLPHPRLQQRRFVLVPLNEIAAGFRDPSSGRTVRELLQATPDRSRVRKVSAQRES